jgi:hypothetical protein
MSPGLVGREKLVLVERVVASREENNIIRIEQLKCAIKRTSSSQVSSPGNPSLMPCT